MQNHTLQSASLGRPTWPKPQRNKGDDAIRVSFCIQRGHVSAMAFLSSRLLLQRFRHWQWSDTWLPHSKHQGARCLPCAFDVRKNLQVKEALCARVCHRQCRDDSKEMTSTKRGELHLYVSLAWLTVIQINLLAVSWAGRPLFIFGILLAFCTSLSVSNIVIRKTEEQSLK